MTHTLATLAFQAQADGLMAGLASRTHQWKSWEMLQCSAFEIEWNGDSSPKITQLSSRVELRIFGDKSQSPLFSGLSSLVSPSLILSSLLSETRSLGDLQYLKGCEAPLADANLLKLTGLQPLKLQGLDATPELTDPWPAPLTEWPTLFPQKPSKILDLRYRNSLGLFAFAWV